MSDTWWFLTRASGIVALALAGAALVLGLSFSARNTGTRRSPAWWLDLHNWLGGLALAFTTVHIVAALLDRDLALRIVDVLVPGTSGPQRWPITWGVIAVYTLVITVFTSWPRRRFSRRVWRAVHLTSVGGLLLAGIHAFQAGTDGKTIGLEVGMTALGAITVYALGVRVIGAVLARRR